MPESLSRCPCWVEMAFLAPGLPPIRMELRKAEAVVTSERRSLPDITNKGTKRVLPPVPGVMHPLAGEHHEKQQTLGQHDHSLLATSHGTLG